MRRYGQYDYLTPKQLDMLSSVLKRTLPENASAVKREAHAATIVRLFQSGIVEEDALVQELGGDVAGSPAAERTLN